MKQLFNFFRDKQVKTLLDVGTGAGNFIEVLREVFPNTQITGIDPNSESLKEAKEKFPGVSFREMGAEKLDFTANTFDVASISKALHHLSDVQKSLSEMMRVVKPGGWIIVNELFSDNLNPAQEVHKMYHHFSSSIDRILGVTHNPSFKKSEILRKVKKSGMDIQVQFEFRKEVNLVSNPEEVELRVEKMRQKLNLIKNFPEYELLKPQIEIFRKKASEIGFHPASRLVIIAEVKK